jgi:hypothetical protein
MTFSLPSRPNLGQLRNRAKDLLKAHSRGDVMACQPLRRLRQFASLSDAELLAAPLALHEAQYATAMSYGFPSWNALKQRVSELRGSESSLRIERDGGRVLIEGVPKLAWGRSGETTFCGALAAILGTTRQPYSYDQLMGLTGLAFRVRWYCRTDVPDWCPSSPVGEFADEIHAVGDRTPWRLEYVNRLETDDPDMQDTLPRVVDSIDSGMPVLGYAPGGPLDMAIIDGYERSDADGLRLRWNSYYGTESVWADASDIESFLLFIEPQERDANDSDPRQAILDAISGENWRLASQPAPDRSDRPGWKCQYLLGNGALEQWSSDISSL